MPVSGNLLLTIHLGNSLVGRLLVRESDEAETPWAVGLAVNDDSLKCGISTKMIGVEIFMGLCCLRLLWPHRTRRIPAGATRPWCSTKGLYISRVRFAFSIEFSEFFLPDEKFGAHSDGKVWFGMMIRGRRANKKHPRFNLYRAQPTCPLLHNLNTSRKPKWWLYGAPVEAGQLDMLFVRLSESRRGIMTLACLAEP